MVHVEERVRRPDVCRTMMKFFVYSRHAIEAIEPHDVPHIIVSISTPPDDPANIKTNEHTLGLLRLWFFDLDQVVEGTEEKDEFLFQAEQAEQILDLVATHPTAEHFIVHCDAGLSRSPACAAAISKIMTGDDASFFRQYYPNRRVYRKILEAHARRTP
jgi:predicted protein tyrosine phosphatase